VPSFDLLPVLQSHLGWAPPWTFGLLVIAGALVAALATHELLVRAVRQGLRRRDPFIRSLIIRTRAPGRFALIVAALSWAATVAPLPDGQERIFQHALLIAFIVLTAWAVMTAMDIGSALHLRRFRIDVADNLQARKLLTQMRILRRTLNVMVMVIAAALILMSIPGVKQVGVSLLAAGGAAGIIMGLALQPLLSNLLAGMQIALTQPIRIDDAVIVEGEWGNVEEITSTYVVIRVWDLRRLIVPLRHFLEKPFQNWTRESAELLGVVMLYLDYGVRLDAVRRKLREILDGSDLWDGKVSAVQVTDAKERSMEVRILASARNSGAAFDLRCEIREKIIAWLQAEHPGALPRDRVELTPALAPAATSVARSGPGEHRVQ
jgi:small-conductance mechanosensitive channel